MIKNNSIPSKTITHTQDQLSCDTLRRIHIPGLDPAKPLTRREFLALYPGRDLGKPSEDPGAGAQKGGTAEWASTTYNIGKGCSHDCLYCYARADAERFGRITSPEAWKCEQLKSTMPRVPRCKGWIMFPSTHDITPFYLPAALVTLKALLDKGNKVLIVTKPHMECITPLCAELAIYREQILFRFTIGSLNEPLAKFWEPGAPAPSERVACLRYAFDQGFQTSVSMEPMLAGTEDAVATFHTLVPWVTDKIWIGKMNQVRRRVARTSPAIEAACDRTIKLQSDEAILELVHRLGAQPKVEWKDSIKAVIASCSSGPNSIPKAISIK